MPNAVSTWGILSLIAGFAGPFGTFSDLDFGERLFYWATIIGVSIPVGRSVRLTVKQQFPNRPNWQTEPIAAIVMIPILSAVICSLPPYLLGLPAEQLPGPGRMVFYVSSVVVVVTGLRIVGVIPLRRRDAAEEQVADLPGLPRLLDRLPEDVAGEVFRLSGRDHHVEVVTATGTATVRMRFSDAIAEMEPVRGHCAHRSHWVSEAAIRDVERDGAKIFLRLVNGDQVPVSRKYKPHLEDAGIL